LFIFVLILVSQVSLAALPGVSSHPNEIAFMTDFGIIDDSVAVCHQVMYNIDPGVKILDITHQVTPFSVVEGARYLSGMSAYVPKGTVFVVVIDPGVGTSRKAIVAKSNKGIYYVLPDNGLLTYVQDHDGIEGVRLIANPKWMIQDAISSTFHGRDIFSPVGAHLARGENWLEVGPGMQVNQLVRLTVAEPSIADDVLKGQIIGLDGPFGNLVTNVSREEFAKLGYRLGEAIHVTIGKTELAIPYAKTFGDVPVGSPLAYIDSRGRLSFGLNQNSFAQKYGIKPPVDFSIPKKR
jgi:hypothetical protein